MARPSLAEAHRGLALPALTVDGNSAVRKSTSEHLDRPRSFRAVAVVSTEPVWTLAQDGGCRRKPLEIAPRRVVGDREQDRADFEDPSHLTGESSFCRMGPSHGRRDTGLQSGLCDSLRDEQER